MTTSRLPFSGRTSLSWVLACLVLALPGCATGPRGPETAKYDIEVSLDPALERSSVLVDLVGINAASLPRWESYSMSEYWKRDDPNNMRRDAERKTLDFAAGNPTTQTLKMSDPQWNQWIASNGVTHVAVLALLPGIDADKPGNADPRRQVVPLDRSCWPKKTQKLVVLVKQSGVVIQTPPRPVK